MWEQKRINTARGTFEYFVKGDGPPLAITHFYTAFNAQGNWFADPFAAHYRVFLINVRGAGHSDPVEADEQMALKEIVLDLEAIREALHISKWAFGGHSTGGMLALEYALLQPHSLTACICGCSAASHAYGQHPDSIYCRENKQFERIVYIMDRLNDPHTPKEVRQQLNFEWALMSFVSEERLRYARTLPNGARTVGKALDYFRKVAVKSYDVRAQLPTIQVKTYVFGGKYDAQCPVVFSEEIAALIQNAKLTIFEQSNHNPFVEEPEAFKQFVSETVASSKRFID